MPIGYLITHVHEHEREKKTMSTLTRSGHLLTAEEFEAEPDDRRTELVEGKVVEMSPTGYRHGRVQIRIARLMGNFVDERDLGDVSGESGVITRRNPDSVRGPDVMFYSWERMPKGEATIGFTEVAPEVIFEVLSPSQTLRKLVKKAEEYLAAGVLCVCIVDPEQRSVMVHERDMPVLVLTEQDTLQLPAPLADWPPRVGDFFPE